ncbi:MAG: 23S rRNA (adenine(2503)-C(2))-methyltransferase RlmN, partial [Burkholderiales bacterium]|nr:23S rRNA (adenine(2503)-C(2))-methyltransferase RlmN [Burkholderiales bacterium]
MSGAETINVLGLDPASLEALVARWGGKPFRARQLSQWVHQRGVDRFQDMSDLAKDFRAAMDARF